MPLIRYPGSKEKLTRQIVSRFPASMKMALFNNAGSYEYREPFFGAGAVGWHVIRNSLLPETRIWLNDADLGIVALWQSVLGNPKELIRLIRGFTPNVEDYKRFQDADGATTGSVVEDGFRKLALHRMSFSGLGAMAGGPIGGASQSNEKYSISCRWRPDRMCREIASLHDNLSAFDSVKITCGDFSALLADVPETCFVYLDPPYYEKGGQLYKHNMSHDDHARLATAMRDLRCPWVLSYDDHPAIRDLYAWASFEPIELTYTCSNRNHKNGVRPKNQEVVITPNCLEVAA